MCTRLLLFGILLTISISAYAAEQFQMNFTLNMGDKKIYGGRSIISQKTHSWSNGLRSSYLKLSCQRQDSGKIKKLYSTEDHFAGLRVTPKLMKEKIELTVIWDQARSRLPEIRKLQKDECKD